MTPKCCKKRPERQMPNKIEISRCKVKGQSSKSHPCDVLQSCNPCKDDDGECKPSICLERLKNPAMPGEITRCKPGAFIKISACDPRASEPPHPCDPIICIPGYRKKVKCPPTSLCYHRVKNPEEKRLIKCPEDTTSEAPQPKQENCVVPGSPEYNALKKQGVPKLNQMVICEMIKKYWTHIPKD